MQHTIYQKRAAQEVLAAGNATGNTGNGTRTDANSNSQPVAVCHMNLEQLQRDGLRRRAHDEDADANLDYDQLLFVNMAGDSVDGRSCDVIYEDKDVQSRVRIVVDEDGNVVDVYTEDDEDPWVGGGSSPPVTAGPPVITATTATRAEVARPGSGEPSLSAPACTTLKKTRLGTVVTPAPAI